MDRQHAAHLDARAARARLLRGKLVAGGAGAGRDDLRLRGCGAAHRADPRAALRHGRAQALVLPLPWL